MIIDLVEKILDKWIQRIFSFLQILSVPILFIVFTRLRVCSRPETGRPPETAATQPDRTQLAELAPTAIMSWQSCLFELRDHVDHRSHVIHRHLATISWGGDVDLPDSKHVANLEHKLTQGLETFW